MRVVLRDYRILLHEMISKEPLFKEEYVLKVSTYMQVKHLHAQEIFTVETRIW
jgi:hypothetical protein